MKTYKMVLRPQEAYFFGHEKSFAFADSKGEKETRGYHFAKGESVPSQSTILGALRYLLLPIRKTDWNYSTQEQEQNALAVGIRGFSPDEKRSFGKIKSISPVFLCGPKGNYVVTPFDHQNGADVYTPFCRYQETESLTGKRLYAADFEAKKGVTDSYMALSDGSIVANGDLFTSVVQNGINRETHGLYKQEKKKLREGFSFGVYVTLSDDLLPKDDVLFLGQNKSAFSVTFQEEENTLEDSLRPYLRDDVVYTLGDSFTDRSIYEKSLFSVTKIKTYRIFSRENKRVYKSQTLYKLIRAGSVFIPENKEEFLSLVRNENTKTIGYNCFVTK